MRSIEVEYETTLGLSWMTLNRPRSRSQDFSIRYLEYGERYNVRHNGGQTGNHQRTFDWDHPSSRSLQLQSDISITVSGMQQHWADRRSIERISCLDQKSVFFSRQPLLHGHILHQCKKNFSL